MKSSAKFELRFNAVDESVRDLVFPCDEHGRVELDGLSEQGRLDYLFARAMAGRHYSAQVYCGASQVKNLVRCAS